MNIESTTIKTTAPNDGKKGCGKFTYLAGTNGGRFPCGSSITNLDKTITIEYCPICQDIQSNLNSKPEVVSKINHKSILEKAQKDIENILSEINICQVPQGSSLEKVKTFLKNSVTHIGWVIEDFED